MKEQFQRTSLQKQVNGSGMGDADSAGGHHRDCKMLATAGQHQQFDACGKAAQTLSNDRGGGYREVVNRILNKPRKQITIGYDRVSKHKPPHQSRLRTVTSAYQHPVRKEISTTNGEEPSPQEMPPSMIGYGAIWPTSGKLAGQPGYGYAADGVPLGATHFRDSSRLSPIYGKDVSLAPSSTGEASRALREIERSGWGRKEDIAHEVIRISKDGQLNVVNTKKCLQKCENAALRRMLKYNSELEL